MLSGEEENFAGLVRHIFQPIRSILSSHSVNISSFYHNIRPRDRLITIPVYYLSPDASGPFLSFMAVSVRNWIGQAINKQVAIGKITNTFQRARLLDRFLFIIAIRCFKPGRLSVLLRDGCFLSTAYFSSSI